MAILPCPNKIGCESDYPLTNYSAEDPDPRTFLGYSTGTAPTSSFRSNTGGGGPKDGGPDRDDTGDGPGGTAQTGTGGNPPPIGSEWDNVSITTFAESTESQAQAHDDAGNDNVSNLGPSSDNGDDTGGWLLPPNRLRPQVFSNDAQTCTILCPDGQPFSFTVAANRIRQLSKAKANAAALSVACKQAQLELICLSAINGVICRGSSFSQNIIAYSANPPITFTITDGDLPDWMNAVVDTTNGIVALTGNPTDASDVGTTNFTITAIDVFGNLMSRAYVISVIGVSSANPDDGVAGSPYSFQITADGGTAPYVFSISSGSLPPGTALLDGEIAGTPIIVDTFDFTIKIVDAIGRTCFQEASLDVLAAPGCPSIIGGPIAVTSINGGMANVGVRSGTSNKMFLGNSTGDSVGVIDTTDDTVDGGVSTGVGLAIGCVYVPEVLGAGNPSDCIYVTSPDGNLVSIDIDTLIVSGHGGTGDTLTNFQRPCIYATTAQRVFFNTLQGASFGPGDNPTATLWYFPIIGGAIAAGRVSTSGTGEAVLALSHYVETTNQVWFTDGELGSNNASLTAMNASTLAVGSTISTIDIISGPGTWCSLNNRFYVPVWPGGSIAVGPWRLDVRTAAGGFIHALSLPSFCRRIVIDTSRNLILALCNDAIRCFDVGDNFVCDVASAAMFSGAFCPENAKTYAALVASTETIG